MSELEKLRAELARAQAAGAEMRAACVGMVAWYHTPESDQPEKLPIRINACEKAIATDCGKELLERLAALEAENGALRDAALNRKEDK